jgi:uncharacterized protein
MTKRIIAGFIGILLSGCADSPSVQFYVLEPLNPIPSSAVVAQRQHTIGIGPVSVPALLEHKQIVTRLSDNSVKIAEFQHWASPLQDNLLQTLTQNISNLQPNNIVRSYPWSIHGTVDLQIIVDIIRFDTTPGKSVNLEANWTIKNETTHAVLKTGHSVINRPLSESTYPATVRALSKILGEFSQQLSSGLLHLR